MILLFSLLILILFIYLIINLFVCLFIFYLLIYLFIHITFNYKVLTPLQQYTTYNTTFTVLTYSVRYLPY